MAPSKQRRSIIVPGRYKTHRSHGIEGRDDGPETLQRRISIQMKDVCKIIDVGESTSDMSFVPKGPELPADGFYWYNLDQDAPKDESTLLAIVLIMAVLADENIELQEEAILELYLNLITLNFEEAKKPLSSVLIKYNYAIDEISLVERMGQLDINTEDLDIEDLDNTQNSVIYTMTGIFLVIIGKQLTSANYVGWMAGRIRTFAQSCGTDANNPTFNKLQPTSRNCSTIYGNITSKWEIRREIFRFIKASSNSKGIISTISRASMVLLNGAELGTFNLTNKHIDIENPILLCWAELAKYSADLIAAIDKYQTMGEDAPYCKLLYPSNMLPEFNRRGLRILATIAREIAILEGQDTLKNYAGTERTSDTKQLVDRALFLVKAAGGANTLTTQAVRDGYFANTSDNVGLKSDLKFGAYVETIEESSDEEEINLAAPQDNP